MASLKIDKNLKIKLETDKKNDEIEKKKQKSKEEKIVKNRKNGQN